MKHLSFNVMLDGRFICSLDMPITLDVINDYVGDMPVIRDGAISEFIERKHPSLRGKDYKIDFNI